MVELVPPITSARSIDIDQIILLTTVVDIGTLATGMVPPEVGSSQIKCQELASFLASGKVTNIGRKAFHRRSAVQPWLQTLNLWVKIEGVFSIF